MRVTDKEELQRLFTCIHGADVAQSILHQMAHTGCVLRGHFRLQSGSHSPYFLRFSLLGRDTSALGMVTSHVQTLAERFSHPGTTLLCAENSGVLLGMSLRDAMALPLAVAKIDSTRHPVSELRRGRISAGDSVLVVTDIVTSGNSIRQLLKCVRNAGASATGVLAFATLDGRSFERLITNEQVAGAALVGATWEGRPYDRCEQCTRAEPLLPSFEFN